MSDAPQQSDAPAVPAEPPRRRAQQRLPLAPIGDEHVREWNGLAAPDSWVAGKPVTRHAGMPPYAVTLYFEDVAAVRQWLEALLIGLPQRMLRKRKKSNG